LKDFTITKVSWHTKQEGAIRNSHKEIANYFFALINFLQKNSLTTRHLASSESEIGEDFEIRASDLTEEGLKLIKAGMAKWLKRFNGRPMKQSDMVVLEKALQKVREANNK